MLLLFAAGACNNPESAFEIGGASRIDALHAPWDGLEDVTRFRCFADEERFYFYYEVADSTMTLVDPYEGERTVDWEDRVEIFFSRDSVMTAYFCAEIDPLGRRMDYSSSYKCPLDYEWDFSTMRQAGQLTDQGYVVAGSVSISASFDDVQLMAYLLAPQQGKYEAPEHAAALYEQYLDHTAALEAQQMSALYRDIEMPLLHTLYAMEREGFLVDTQELQRLGMQMSQQISRLREEIYALCDVEPFNLNSTQQLGAVLFDKLGLPAKKKTQRGYSTDADTLQELSSLHPVIDKILAYRQVSKLHSTYIDGLLRLTGRDGRVHSWFDQTIAATGRISSSEPNLQNIPVRTEMGREIRRAFIAKPGHVLVDADYSQIELRLLAHLSGDEAMCDAFNRGQDIHARTAAEVYGVPLDEVTSQMRSSAKAVNFGIVYGISDFGLAANLHISRREAGEFIDRYFERYGAVRRFMDACVSQGKAEGYSVTMYGRRRPLPELTSPNYNRRQFGERAAMNTPVQGAAADIIKIAMNTVHERLGKEGFKAKLILQVHDELIVECPESEREAVENLLRQSMEGAAQLRVPLVADVHAGKSWYDTK